MTDRVDTPRGSRALAWMLACLVLLTFVDLGSKEWALQQLSRERAEPLGAVCQPDAQGRTPPHRLTLEPRTFIPGFIEFVYAENCGMAFSMLRTAPSWLRTTLFSGAATVVSVMLIAMFVRGRGGRLFAVGVPVTLSGALGNLADRLRHGFVVDFIRFDPDLINYPTYNVADIALIVGLGLILIDDWVKPKAATPASAA